MKKLIGICMFFFGSISPMEEGPEREDSMVLYSSPTREDYLCLEDIKDGLSLIERGSVARGAHRMRSGTTGLQRWLKAIGESTIQHNQLWHCSYNALEALQEEKNLHLMQEGFSHFFTFLQSIHKPGKNLSHLVKLRFVLSYLQKNPAEIDHLIIPYKEIIERHFPTARTFIPQATSGISSILSECEVDMPPEDLALLCQAQYDNPHPVDKRKNSLIDYLSSTEKWINTALSQSNDKDLLEFITKSPKILEFLLEATGPGTIGLVALLQRYTGTTVTSATTSGMAWVANLITKVKAPSRTDIDELGKQPKEAIALAHTGQAIKKLIEAGKFKKEWLEQAHDFSEKHHQDISSLLKNGGEELKKIKKHINELKELLYVCDDSEEAFLKFLYQHSDEIKKEYSIEQDPLSTKKIITNAHTIHQWFEKERDASADYEASLFTRLQALGQQAQTLRLSCPEDAFS